MLVELSRQQCWQGRMGIETPSSPIAFRFYTFALYSAIELFAGETKIFSCHCESHNIGIKQSLRRHSGAGRNPVTFVTPPMILLSIYLTSCFCLHYLFKKYYNETQRYLLVVVRHQFQKRRALKLDCSNYTGQGGKLSSQRRGLLHI